METLRRAAAVTLLRDYFDVAGYRLVVRESEGWAGLFPDLDRITAVMTAISSPTPRFGLALPRRPNVSSATSPTEPPM